MKLPSFWRTDADSAPRRASTDDGHAFDGIASSLESRAILQDIAELFWQIDDIGRTDAGYNRFAWTSEEAQLRLWFAATMQRRGFNVSIDAAGNQWAWLGDPTPERPGMTVGSHLDSVPDGGPFDGPLGVLSAIAAYDLLHREGWTPACPLGIVNFHDEEGARFAIACFGSRSLTGILTPQNALQRHDANGVSYAEALMAFPHTLAATLTQAQHTRALRPFTAAELRRAADASKAPSPQELASDPTILQRSAVHVELHIEQGCTQREQNAPVAVASKIWPHGRWRIDIDGVPNHAGCSPIAQRHDPTLGLARFIIAAREEAERHHSRTTVGRIQIAPNGVNVIPSHVTCWLDCRAQDEQQVLATLSALRARGERGEFESHGSRQCRDFSIRRESWTQSTPFSPALQRELTGAISEEEGAEGAEGAAPSPVNGTAAGHDAGILSEAGSTAGMLFVRNNTGASHTPDEYATPGDCICGVRAYASAMKRITTAIAEGRKAK